MAEIVSSFKALTLGEMIRAYPEIAAALNAAKDLRRQALEQEIRDLGFMPGASKRTPPAALKYTAGVNRPA